MLSWHGIIKMGAVRLLDIFTCVPIIGEGERSVAKLAVAQWGHWGQTGVIFSLCAHHVDRGLRRTTALWEILRPLGLTHQAFLTGRKDRSSDVTQSHGPLAPRNLLKSLIDQPLIIQDNHPVVLPLELLQLMFTLQQFVPLYKL